MTPAELDPYVRQAAEQFGVSPELVHDVIRVESRGNPQAVSPAGARGLMQIMPTTWDYIRTRIDLPDDPFHVAGNILAGTWFLARLLERYSGDPHKALAAYNWGPGRVDKHPDPSEWPAQVVRYVEAVISGQRPSAPRRPRGPQRQPATSGENGGGFGLLVVLALAWWAWKGGLARERA